MPTPPLAHLWNLLRPAPLHADRKERLRAALGAGLGILAMALLCHALGLHFGLTPWLLAPLGASAVLVFVLPGSPMAQPWAVIVGNTLSSAVGVLVVCTLPADTDPALAGGLAVCLAIGLMMATRSLHPPGGAMALTAVLSHAHAWPYPIFPGFGNSLLLVLAGVAYNPLTGKRYPHGQSPVTTANASANQLTPMDEVLRRYNQVLDVSRDDLEALLHETERLAYRQRLDELRCENIMTRELIKVQFGTSLQEAWELLRRHEVKALPVVDQYDNLVGIITLADFMRHADLGAGLSGPDTLGQRLKAFIKATPGMNASKAEVVGQIMTRQVRVASAQRPLAELVSLFTHDGHHHIPIVGDKRKLVGIITQSDFLRAWSKAVHEGWQQP